jgi:hypothetical protein
MNGSAVPERWCRVIGGELLPASAVRPDQICTAIEAAVKARVPDAIYSVEVRVLTGSSLSATVRLKDESTLPEQRMAVSDNRISGGSIDRFAATIAAAIAGASQ